jgi:hypothetical protein
MNEELKLLKMLEEEKDLTKCTFKVYVERGILNKDDNKHCLECNGFSSVTLCRYYCSVNHYLNFYQQFKQNIDNKTYNHF